MTQNGNAPLHLGSALHWCVDVALALQAGAADAETVTLLLQLKTEKIPAPDLVRKARVIWYSHEERRPIDTLTAKLYEAAAALENKDILHYRRALAVLVSELLITRATSSFDPRVSKATELFRVSCELLSSQGENDNDDN